MPKDTSKRIACGLCGAMIKAAPLARYSDSHGGNGHKYPLHLACAMILHQIHQSPSIEGHRNAVMAGPRYRYSWEKDRWY
jgi:hypothetical protein